MTEHHAVERDAVTGAEHLAFQTEALQRRGAQFGGEDQQAFRRIDQFIDELGMDVERLVAGNRPRRRRPDHRVGGLLGQRVDAESAGQPVTFAGIEREGDVDGRRFLVGILDLGLGQRRTAVEAPVHRLQALEQVAAPVHLAERADLVGLGAVFHGLVGMIPVTEHAEADEILLLPLDLLLRVGAAERARLVGRQVLAVGLFDLVLDGQAVAVPARDVGRIEAGQGLGADDDVLEDLVHRMADVDVAVGIGRAVVQHEARTALATPRESLIELLFLPVLHPARLALGEVAAHRERGVGHVEGFAIISFLVGHLIHSKFNQSVCLQSNPGSPPRRGRFVR